MTLQDNKSPAFVPHDHAHCAQDALDAARARGLRLTPVREAALRILLENHRALGAYDVLEKLRERGFGGQPPVAYRALSFLVEHGLAHRIEQRNAFVACLCGDHAHEPVFLICRQCGRVAEAEAPALPALDAAAAALGFRRESASIELVGLCPACDGAAP